MTEEEIDEEIENWAELRRKYWDEFLPMQELDAQIPLQAIHS